jgi:predicted nucleotide-binding protein
MRKEQIMAKRLNRNMRAETNGSDEDMRGRVKSEFPKHTLDSTLRIPRTLEEMNGGRPMPPTDLAIAMGVSPGSSDYRVLLSSALRYGLTTGNYKSERVSLSALGSRIVSPTSSDDQRLAEAEAALAPATFAQIYQFFKGKKLPEAVFFHNVVTREFDVPREHAVRCVEVFTKNMDQLGLIRVAPTGKWLSTEPVSSRPITNAKQSPESSNHDDPEAIETDDELEPTISNVSDSESTTPATPSAIFVGHGKNKRPLEQLKQILDHYRIPYRVAVDEANHFRPISDKVGDTMRECGAAILIFTADEELKTIQGETIWRPSENVVHELGAASILYGGRIIIFKEDAVRLPTNFSGIGYISFGKDDLASKAHDLFRELVSFGLIKITVGG